jgi:hypothetical protein
MELSRFYHVSHHVEMGRLHMPIYPVELPKALYHHDARVGKLVLNKQNGFAVRRHRQSRAHVWLIEAGDVNHSASGKLEKPYV